MTAPTEAEEACWARESRQAGDSSASFVALGVAGSLRGFSMTDTMGGGSIGETCSLNSELKESMPSAKLSGAA